ncbi:MAG: sigma-54-dependent Fis family transcriptional regulator [Planctomycetes bacterium]|nr:sigma-54-dependent Fis family transcriptional regulator [Planctomycetota bacterium]
MPLTLLLLDDDAPFRTSLALMLARQGFEVVEAESLGAACELLKSRAFDAVLVDQDLPDGQGKELLRVPVDGVAPEFVFITGTATIDDAVAALKGGAMDFLTKPIDPTKLQTTLATLRRTRALKRELVDLREEVRARGRFGSIVGRSSAMQPVFDLIQRVAPTEASVLIQGESGTGTEVVAETIHAQSRRSDKPLLPVNCGAIPESLIESELFGHERGSFTGADRQHRGFFERADGGTLFLDEITEMPAQLQVKLLRVLETGVVHRVGSSVPVQTDVRVLAATNRSPDAAIKAGKLREDLYFRLAVFPMRLPPLRERIGDVELLAQHFLDALNQHHRTDKRWHPDALVALADREWRGNVRELKNGVQRAYILADDLLRAEDTTVARPADSRAPTGTLAIQVGASIADAERELIHATLEHTRGDKAGAAAILGISLKTLYNRLNVYDAAKS